MAFTPWLFGNMPTKKKSHPWPEKASNGSDAEAISMVTSSYVAEQKMKDVTQTPSAA
jgi:hypothetical protein